MTPAGRAEATRSSRSPTGGSDSGWSIRRAVTGRPVFDFERRPRGRARAGARGAAAPLLRRDDPCDRPARRLGRGRPRAGGRPRDADRLGARAAGRRRDGRRRGARAGRASSAARRGSSSASIATRRASEPHAKASADAAGDDGQLALFGELLPTAPRPSASSCRRSSRSPPRRCTTCAGSPTARSRSSSAARTGTSRSASLGLPPARASVSIGRAGRAAWRRPRSATRFTGCSSIVPLDRPGAPEPGRARAHGPGVVRAGRRRRARPDRRARGRVLRLRPRGAPGGAPGRPPGAAVRVRARRRAPPRPARRALARRGARARRRLQVERARRRRSRGGRRGGVPAPAPRVRARVPPRRRRARWRSSTSSSSGRTTSSRATFAQADVAGSRPSSPAAIARIRAGDFRPTPSEFACSGCPALDLVCAGPRLLVRAVTSSVVRVAALDDIHGNLPALEAVLADVEREGVDAIVVRRRRRRRAVLGRGLRPRSRVVGRSRSSAGTRTGVVVERRRREHGLDWEAERERLGADAARAIASWPLTVELGVDGLGRVLFCHATPTADEPIFTRITPDEDVARAARRRRRRRVVCGHTHVQFDRRLPSGLRIVNAGSVGMPYEGRRGAFWALLGPDVELRRTEYDVEAAVAAIRRARRLRRRAARGYVLEPPDPDETTRVLRVACVARSYVARGAAARARPAPRAHRPDRRAARRGARGRARSRSASARISSCSSR